MDWTDIAAVAVVIVTAAVLWCRLLWVAAREVPYQEPSWQENADAYYESEQGEQPWPEEHLP